MKIVFVSIGVEYLGIELMAAKLKEEGHEVKAICDESLFDDKNYFTIMPLAKLFNRREEVIQEIIDEKPDLVGVTVITPGFKWAQEITDGLKARRPDIKTMMGGVHVTCVPDTVIAKQSVDMICVGEGLQAILELANSLDSGEDRTDIKNIWFKRNGEIIKNPQRPELRDADAFPMMDKTVYEDQVPMHVNHLTMSQFGCPFACAFCTLSTLGENSKANGGRPLHIRSVDNFLNELTFYRERNGYDSIFNMANTFTSSKKWTLEWAEKYPKKIGMPYKVATHPTKVDDDVARALKESGCHIVQLGVESFSPEVRAQIFHRYETNEEIVAATDAMDKAGLRYTMDYILGAPLQTEEEYREAAEFFITRKMCLRITPFFISFLPNTPLVKIAKDKGLLTDKDIEMINDGVDECYLSTGSIVDKQVLAKLMLWRLYFRLIPILPENASRFLLKNDRFKYLRFLPVTTVLLFVDVIVALWVKDYTAIAYMKTYFWNFRKIFRSKKKTWTRKLSERFSSTKNVPGVEPAE